MRALRAFHLAYVLVAGSSLTLTCLLLPRGVHARIPSVSKERRREDHGIKENTIVESRTAIMTTPTTTANLEDHPRGYQNHSRSLQMEDCSGLDAGDPSSIQLLLTQEFMVQKVNESLQLSGVVSREKFGPIEDIIDEYRTYYERFDGFSDCDDQALVAKTKDTQICFATFEPTDRGNGDAAYWSSQWQNINPFCTRIADCVVRKGYKDAYNATYKNEFRASLDACVASCDGGCPLVLAGESSGGAIAVVAAIDLAHYDPEVITFAAPRAVKDYYHPLNCETLNPLKHYRFVNSDQAGTYDCVVNQINIYNEKFVGRLILLDEVNYPIATAELSDNKSRMPTKQALHEYPVYKERIEAMIARGCFPIPVAGWIEGHVCRYDDECQTSYCDNCDGKCAKKN